MSVREFLIGLIEVGRLSLHPGGTISWARVADIIKQERVTWALLSLYSLTGDTTWPAASSSGCHHFSSKRWTEINPAFLGFCHAILFQQWIKGTNTLPGLGGEIRAHLPPLQTISHLPLWTSLPQTLSVWTPKKASSMRKYIMDPDITFCTWLQAILKWESVGADW